MSKKIMIKRDFSPETRDLLKGMLQRNENKRFDIKDVLNHPAFKEQFYQQYKIEPDVFDSLVRNYMLKTLGGDGKFIPESLRTLNLKDYLTMKTTRTQLGNIMDLEEEVEVKKEEKSKFEQIKEFYQNQ